MTSSTTLRTAADLIDEHGWTRGMLRNPRGCYCAMGAIAAASGIPVAPDTRQWAEIPTITDDAKQRLASTVTALLSATRMRTERDIQAWNDAAFRTAGEVTRVLRAAADLTEAGERV